MKHCLGFNLVIRLYSEIDQIHLSSEAQCDTALLPLGDCHTEYLLVVRYAFIGSEELKENQILTNIGDFKVQNNIFSGVL